MESERFSRDYRGGIKQFVKNKGQVIASGAVLGGLSIFGMCEASNADNSNDDEYQDSNSTRLVDESFVQAESYQSFIDRIIEEAKENADQMEQEMQRDEEFNLETPTPTAASTPTPTMTPTPIPPTPSESYIPSSPSGEVSAAGSQSSVKVLQDGESIWIVLADCETGDAVIGPPYFAQWDYNGQSGFDGGLQFLPTTWNQLNTGYDYAWQAPFDVQIEAAQRWLELTDWYQWPACYEKMRAAGYLK